MQQTLVQKYIFMSTETYHVVKYMADVHTKKAQLVQCVPQCLEIIRLQNYTRGRILC